MINNIQVLRGYAALAVVLSHVGFIGIGGFGVDIFFAISGFIMALITQKDFDAFVIKRAVRIVPLYWIMTFLVCVVAFIKPSVLASTTVNASFLFKSLFFIPFDKNGYIEPILAVGWTLNYEIFFYFIFFLSMKINHNMRVYVASFILTLLPVVGFLFDDADVIFNFYTSSILIEFIYGMLIFEAFKRGCRFPGSQAFFIFVIAALIFTMSITDAKIAIEYRFLTWGLPSALIVLLSVCALKRLPFTHIFTFIGKISFSLYLSHLFVIRGFDRVFYSLDELTLMTMLLTFVLVSLAVFLSYISWFLIENLLHNYLNRKFICKNIGK